MPAHDWYVVTAPWFCCAVKVEDGVVVDAAPILKWILARRDRSLTWLKGYCRQRRWTLELLTK